MPGDAAPVVKIGLLAPFEGLGRPLGYEVLPAMKLAVSAWNNSGRLGRYRVAIVALNDDDRTQPAAIQARALGEDPAVMVALGPWSGAAAEGAVPVLTRLRIASLPATIMGQAPVGVSGLCPPANEAARQILQRAARLGASQSNLAGPENALGKALSALMSGSQGGAVTDRGARPSAYVYSGDAAQGATWLSSLHSSGWQGLVLAGPDVMRPWLIGRGGESVEGLQALACTPASPLPAEFAAAYRRQTGVAPGIQAQLAYGGTELILAALAKDIGRNGTPTRQGAARALAERDSPPGLAWYQVQNGEWAPVEVDR